MSAAKWKKCENEHGFIYYINEITNTKQWDHQKFADIKLRLQECNYIKFANYRVAHKFRVLQYSFNVDEVTLSTIQGVFERHKFGANENSLILEACDLEAVLSDVFFAANKLQHLNIDVDTATELISNFIYNVFDADRGKHVEVLSCKLTLALLSNCTLNDLYAFIFSLGCDHNNCITRLRLQAILSRIIAITIYLNESASYGVSLVNSSIAQCFKNSPGLVGIDDRTFYQWLDNTPQILAWLPILHRIKVSQLVLHKAKCCVCKQSPIIGMKYKCVKCTGYVQCQRCFLNGRISQSHKTSHVMKEHCRDSNEKHLKQRFKHKLFKMLKCKYSFSETLRGDLTIMTNHPVTTSLAAKSSNSPEMKTKSDEKQIIASPLTQLQIIIKQLEQQSKELQAVLSSCGKNDNFKKCVEEQCIHIASHLQKLKALGECLSSLHLKNPSTGSLPNAALSSVAQVQSTPMVPSTFKTLPKTLHALESLSPITQKPRPQPNHRLDDIPSSANLTSNAVMANDYDFSSAIYTMDDISTWLAGPASGNDYQNQMHNEHQGKSQQLSPCTQEQSDLDDALTKLQQILTNNFSLDDNINTLDNRQLKSAVSDVEDALSSIIDTAELNNCHQQFVDVQEAPSSSCYSSALSNDCKLRSNYSNFSKYLSAEG